MRRFGIVALAATALLNWAGTEQVIASLQACVAWHADIIEEPDLPTSPQVPSHFVCFLSQPEAAVTVVASGDWRIWIWLGGECGVGPANRTLSSEAGDNNMPGGAGAVLPDAIPGGACAEGRVLSPGSAIFAFEKPSA